MNDSGHRKPAMLDLGLAAIVFLLVLAGLVAFDFFERVFQFTRAHEGWELDELVAIIPALAFAAAWYAYRRWRESERLRKAVARSVDELKSTTEELTESNRKAQSAQAALRSSEQALSQAHQVARLAHWRWSFETNRLTSWSDDFPEMFGVTHDEVRSDAERRFRLVHPDDRADLAAIYQAATSENSSFEAQYRIIRGTGDIRHFREVAEPEYDSEGRAVAHFGIVQDITEQRKAEQALGESERRYRSLYYSTPAMMHSVDAMGRLLSVSDHWLEVMGYEREEVIGRELATFMTEASADYARLVALPEFRRAGRIKDVEYHFVTKNGEVIEVLLSAISERDQEGRFVRSLAVTNDVTERNRTEAKLRQALRLEAVGQLTGGVAHDFNNLLASIMLNAGFLGKKSGAGKKREPFVEQIQKAVGRGRALTERLLAFSRKQPLSPQSSDLSDLIAELDDMLRLTVGAAVELQIKHAGDLWPAMIDPNQFDNALVNLAINARDAMPRGGSLVIETANVTLDARDAEQHGDIMPGRYVKLSVEDTGRGMPPEVAAKAFEPFFTTKEVGEGSGLGLSMVYGFVKQSNGLVTVDSKVDRGTTVTLYLPKSDAAPTKVETAEFPIEVAPGSGRVLLVEDDPELRQASVSLLRSNGYEIIEAETGQGALKQLRSGTSFDLLLTDIVLPGGMNGAELAAKAHKHQPGLKILYITGYAEPFFGPKGKLDPGMRLIRKPFTQEELLEQVRVLCDSKSILLIEDEESVRIALAKAMENAGYGVACAVNGAEAAALIRSREFDAIVTDIVMDEGEGVETLKTVQESGTGTPVIAISGYPTYLRSIKHLGAAATLRKPFEIDELLDLMAQVTRSPQDRPRAHSA